MATKKSTQSEIVSIPSIEFKTFRMKLIGETPLVTCPFSLKQMRQIEDKQQGVPKTKKHDIRNPMEDFINALYWLTPPPKEYTEEAFLDACANGARFGFHVGGIKNSAIFAAVRRGIIKNRPEGRGLFTILDAETDLIYEKSCIEILTDEPPKMRKDCLSTFNSGADMRYRPQFDKWSMEFDVKYDAGAITMEHILTWFQLGGFACGLGENRAEKGEGWGAYRVG